MPTDTLVRPQTRTDGPDTDDDDGLVSHYFLADQSLEAMITGAEIIALCGIRLVPTRDPERYPTCSECAELRAELGGPGARRRLEHLNGRPVTP